MPKARKKRTSAPGKRHRRDNGPAEYQVEPVPPPDPQSLGTLTRYTTEILAGGPRALIAAQHKAAELSARFGEEFEAQWCLLTPYLQQLNKGVDPAAKPADSGQVALDDDHRSFDVARYSMTERNRARARFAMTWRPKFLAILALTHSPDIAARAAKVAVNTTRKHRAADPDFAEQWLEAQEHALQLLHDVTMKSAIEGECEPIFWQGIECGHIRKVDNRLRIEMLRAHMPKKFQTPGTKVAINTGAGNNNLFICGPEEQDRLIALRQESLRRIAAAKVNPAALPAESAPSGALNSQP
jgi:hypothetical protein